jgi:hypothetical protein
MCGLGVRVVVVGVGGMTEDWDEEKGGGGIGEATGAPSDL